MSFPLLVRHYLTNSCLYRKDISVGPLSHLVVNGRCRYLGTFASSLPETTSRLPAAVSHAACDAGMLSGRPQLQPSFSLHVEFGGGAATWSGHGIAFQQKVPITRHVGFEVRATAFCTLLWHCISQLQVAQGRTCCSPVEAWSHVHSMLSLQSRSVASWQLLCYFPLPTLTLVHFFIGNMRHVSLTLAANLLSCTLANPSCSFMP